MRALLVVVLLGLFGCGIADEGCSDASRTYDVIFGAPAEEVNFQAVRDLQSEGWRCPSETLYNAFGKAFGVRYSCSKC